MLESDTDSEMKQEREEGGGEFSEGLIDELRV